MKRTQDRILAAIEAAIEAGEWGEFVQDTVHANTGYIGCAKKGEVVPGKRLYYSFQDTYATFKVPGSQRTISYMNYAAPHRQNDEFAKILSYLTGEDED